MDFKIGATFYRDRRKHHIINTFNDNGIDILVTKFYGKHKQWWHYHVFEADSLKEEFKIGLVTTSKRSVK